MKDLKKADDKKHKETCTKIREDGAYVEAGENDNLLAGRRSLRSVSPRSLSCLASSL
jgi:phosphate transport system substrate-binding protein